MARLRIIETETFPDLLVLIPVTTEDLNRDEDELFQVPSDIADRYFRAQELMRVAEDHLLGWLWNNKHGDAQRVIPNTLEKWERRKRDNR